MITTRLAAAVLIGAALAEAAAEAAIYAIGTLIGRRIDAWAGHLEDVSELDDMRARFIQIVSEEEWTK